MTAFPRILAVAPGADAVPAARGLFPPTAGFGHTLWVVPTPAHADAVRRALAAGGGCFAPNVFTWQAFADAVAPGKPLSDATRRLLFDAAADRTAEAYEYRGYADAVAEFVRELKYAGITPKDAVAEDAALAGPVKRAAAAARLREKLHLAGDEDRLAAAVAAWHAGRRGPFAGVRNVAVVGFADFPFLLLRQIQAFAATADTVVTVPADPAGGRDETFASTNADVAELVGPVDLFSPAAAPVEVPFPPRPAGIAHLARTLFGAVEPASDATGVHLIEAPGPVGEARLVARRVRDLLAAGAAPDDIVVTARHVGRAGGLREVFEEYEIPTAWPDADPPGRSPAVGMLVRAWRLADDDFPFPGVAAVLRSTFFRPTGEADADLPLRAESLLRQLGEPAGRKAYLAAADDWARSMPVPLEDEHGDAPRRKRLHALAKACRPFLHRFFRLWDGILAVAPPAKFAARFAKFAADLGPARDPAVVELLARLSRWAEADWPVVGSTKTVPRATFQRMIAAAAAGVPDPVPQAGRVRVLPAGEARGAACEHLLVIDLGEGTFPDLSPPTSVLTDAVRVKLRAAGVKLPDPDGRLGAEQLLFLELVSRPTRSLTLSFAAVDAKGQPLLPSSFLTAAVACFAPGVIPAERKRMLIDGYADRPLSAAEIRVRAARLLAAGEPVPDALPADMLANLHAARAAADARLRTSAFGPYDGLLRSQAARDDLATRVGPDKVFSPTALEVYAACPFRFWLEHVLRLAPLDEPGDDVEQTRRGSAVHRALARFHTVIRDETPDVLREAALPAVLGNDLAAAVTAAVAEYADRAAGPVGRVLWELEGRRLARAVKRYRGHWGDFRDDWREKHAVPTPAKFEAGFGLPPEPDSETFPPLVLQTAGGEVRVGGKIDRIDAADLGNGERGFWVIDYKTGGGSAYTAGNVAALKKLQLPLYAMAVEDVILAPGGPARPLGLAYWMFAADGPKLVLPGKKSEFYALFADRAGWDAFREKLVTRVGEIVAGVRGGDFPLAPDDPEKCTQTCPFGPVCRIGPARVVGKRWPLPVVW